MNILYKLILSAISLASCVRVLGQAPDAQNPPARWATEEEIIRLAYAIDLADFPFKQKDLSRQLPLPPMQGYMGGKSARSPAGAEATIYALTNPSTNAGFYALRVVIKLPTSEGDAAIFQNQEVIAVELLFVAQPTIFFSPSLFSPHRSRLQKMKAEMKRDGLTPKEYVELHWKTQPEFFFQSSITEKNEPTSRK